jgi:hypothetical protein
LNLHPTADEVTSLLTVTQFSLNIEPDKFVCAGWYSEEMALNARA